MPHGIIICGLNGSGKTTLGAALSNALGYKHIDIEDYYFIESDIPYTKSRTREEVQSLILNDIKKHGDFVLSAVHCDMGEEINSMYTHAVCLSAPLELRLARVKQRAYDKFGDRVLAGGDMYEKEQDFYNFVVSRNMEQLERELSALPCPVIRADGTREIAENIRWLTSIIENKKALYYE